ncbi:DUF58 domain-containing protein [Haliea sp. AH-315-K21]|uniref:Uncharacterized protein n=1 Tax=SAR86 cluster bacterium TaxID=2030880 RepID=A0A2A5CEH5_9GAMM|nr:DUF58 domain-containing protein [Haliea sp. AH-315-K21]MBN4075183.1 DUF58 domain-containing protein [Gammaproteobacteria bacterium AH-315-E17]PCJ42133.1 MAG: hypothetical protein COA71_05955 [SAR86 cluster bacterium]
MIATSQTEAYPKTLNPYLIWRRRFGQWVVRRIPPSKNIELHLNNIFIIPTMQGLGFCFVLALMFIGAINYETSLAFALVFLLIGVFILAIFYTYRNLSGLHLSGLTDGSVFVGENAEITIIVNRHGKRTYEAIELGFEKSRKVVANLIENKEQRLSLFVPTLKRGQLNPGRLRVETFYPFGLHRAWSLVDLDLNCLVYPIPIECDLNILNTSDRDGGKVNITRGNDDFYNLREYQPGDPLKHVAWKNFAKGQGMYTKQYSSNIDDKIWLSWSLFSELSKEDRLSRLCYCVLKLDASGVDYGLDIPECVIEPNKGIAHYHSVLRALALF